PGWALAVFVGAALTDLLDGWVARSRGMSSRLGAFLDPVADKLLLTASFVTLTYLKAVPFWITAVVISRDMMLVVGALTMHMVGVRIYPKPSWAGKAAMFFQVLTVLTGVLARWFELPLTPWAIMWLAAVFTIVSGLQYLVQGVRFLNAANAAERDESETTLLR
ncbi:MAG TPA: CDP-alcohol phosphatidyltransferase family protein, partial [Methylomirabilota bacterium]|nr:CDP-alcohol phosphatidyltransferase family protein [Methylomirabilota bacterium]